MSVAHGSTAALIVAAGRGLRAGGGIPKQYRPLAGGTVLARTIAAFASHPRVDSVLAVIAPGDGPLFAAHVGAGVATVTGADTRAGSVRAGLDALAGRGVARVLIHDGARPLVSAALIGRVLDALDTHPAAAPALPVTDALWQGADGLVAGPHPRDGLYRAQTPQGFRFDAIRAAHAAHRGDAPDDVAVACAAGLPVAIVPGDEDNLKITMAEDFARAERLLAHAPDIRVGSGYDVHALGPGDHVILCGIRIPHDGGLIGHSDADVAMHAITDAIYGALADGDIGRHFPPSDMRWKGAASDIFLRHAGGLAAARGYRIAAIDCTIVCERPRIGPHAAAMAARIGEILGLGPGRVGIKATTSEQLGFTGRGEGIAAQATATLIAP